MVRGPIITKSDHSRRVRKFRSVFLKFGDRVEAAAKDMHSLGGILEKIKWEDPQEGDLLKLSTMLAHEIKTGMLKRKDREEYITVLASLVWFMRLEQNRREQIISAWS